MPSIDRRNHPGNASPFGGRPQTNGQAEKPKAPQHFKATRALILNDDLTTTEFALIAAIGLYDWGDGRGGHPCNATLIKAARLKTGSKDGGQRCVRTLIAGLARREYLRVETFAPSKENPTGRTLHLLPKVFGEQANPGHTSPGGEDIQVRGVRTYKSGPSPDIQVRQIDPSSSLDPRIDPAIGREGADSAFNDDDQRGTIPMTPAPASAQPLPPQVIEARTRQVAERKRQEQRRAELRLEANPRPIIDPAGEVRTVVESFGLPAPPAPDVEPAPEPPTPVAPVLDRAMVDVKQAASMQDEPMMREGPVIPGHDDLPEGMRRFLNDIGADRRSKFREMSPGMQRLILAEHAGGFNSGLFEFQVSEIDRARGAQPGPTITATATTADLIMVVAGGEASMILTLAESLCQDFGQREDRQRWGALRSLAEQLWRRQVSAEDVLDAYRQAMGPKAENRGAVFTHALRHHGWRP